MRNSIDEEMNQERRVQVYPQQVDQKFWYLINEKDSLAKGKKRERQREREGKLLEFLKDLGNPRWRLAEGVLG